WNSDPDNDITTAAVPFSSGVRHDRGTVGSISVSVDAVAIKNADIWGYAATGNVTPTVGANGLVGPFGTPAGTVHPNHVSTDFTANFDPVTNLPPAGATIGGGITGNLNLPR